jgi:hypothetical protein
MYGRDFHKSIENLEQPQAAKLAEFIRVKYNPSVFIDFGASSGLYLREIKKVMPDIESVGYEFSKEAVDNALCPDLILADLTFPLERNKKDNTVGICLEVLEHISEDNWRPVLQNISKLCDVIFFSAASPGQDGLGHINCRWKIDWIRRFNDLGWVVDLDQSRNVIRDMETTIHMGWFTNNAMVLVKS